ncbi:MAG: uroporphyrinogen decarboxylase family protein [Saccharofermentanales bacterium]
MRELDLEQFWKDDEVAHQNNCFNPETRQMALGIRMSEECVFAELGEEGNPWGYIDSEKKLELNKRYNEKAIKIVGKSLLPEVLVRPKESYFPNIKRIGEVFEGRYFYHNETEWLEGNVKTPLELEAMLDRVEKLDLRSFILPTEWESEKKRIYEKYGYKPNQSRSIRGPVTLATSIYGTENLIYLIFDEPELAQRFSTMIGDVAIGIANIMDEEAGYTKENAPRGYSFADDNCALLTDEMYELFGYPVLKKIFETFCPNEGDNRYQHSDSDMKHLLPILGRLNLTGCNFGPNVLVDAIRRYMPKTRIDGCIAPFTFMNNDIKKIIAEVRRDCEMASECKGLNIFTAGSINNGSMLTSMRTVMETILEYRK